MKTPSRWKPQAFLEGLRPDPGYKVEQAFVATYSADVVSIGATLLALAGRDDDRGSGTRADMAEAVESLRGRLRILVQKGRITRPRARLGMASLFDQFVVDIPFDESERSWHPKLVVVRYVNADRQQVWKLWLGSRNLTTSTDLDFGVLLDGGASAKRGDQLQDFERLVREVATWAALPNVDVEALASAATRVKWDSPKGLAVKRTNLLSRGNAGRLPQTLSKADEVLLISPFLDGTFVARIGAWGAKETTRRILSTEMELRKLAHQAGQPLKGFSTIAAYAAPDSEPTDPNVPDTEMQAGPGAQVSEDEFVIRGLHAKILAVRTGTKWLIWAGSANATSRGWEGTNTEVVAECQGDSSVGEGLVDLVKSGIDRKIADLLAESIPPEDVDEKRLERVRAQIVAHWVGHVRRDDDHFYLVSAFRQPIELSGVSVSVGLATGTLQTFSPAAEELHLGRFGLAEQTALLQWRITAGALQCAWMQRADVRPELDANRDMALIATHLGAQEFAAWVRSLLRGEGSGGSGDPWDTEEPDRRPRGATNALVHLNLEEILACHGRDPGALKEMDARLSTYLRAVIEYASDDPAAVKRLQEVERLWANIRAELVD